MTIPARWLRDHDMWTLPKPISHADPEHRQGLKRARPGERPRVNGLETAFGRQAGHHFFGIGVATKVGILSHISPRATRRGLVATRSPLAADADPLVGNQAFRPLLKCASSRLS